MLGGSCRRLVDEDGIHMFSPTCNPFVICKTFFFLMPAVKAIPFPDLFTSLEYLNTLEEKAAHAFP